MTAFAYVFELDWRKILGKDICDLFSSWNQEEIYCLFLPHILECSGNVFQCV